ncbi:MAG: hypothetical protein J0H80_18610 [Rhizobiales bacterium]|nr:hypothetical protein [Hyphomicrobiales bacterium]
MPEIKFDMGGRAMMVVQASPPRGRHATLLPRFITTTSSAITRTVAMSWVMKR